MKERGIVQVKLLLAMLLVAILHGVSSFILFEARGFRSPYIHVASFSLGVLALSTIFYSGMAQLFFGWNAAVASLFLLGFCILDFPGTDLIPRLMALGAGVAGSYLLLRDSDVRIHRKGILRKEWS